MFVKEDVNAALQLQAYHEDSPETSFSNNFLFHLFHEINFIGAKHHILYNFIDIIIIIQTFIASFWLTSTHIWIRENVLIDGFASIIDFRIHKYKNANVYYICGIVLFLIFLIWAIYLYFQYRNTRCFLKIHLYVLLFLFYSIFPIICPVYGSFLSRSFIDLVNNTTPSSIIIFIIYIFIYIVMVTVNVISINFKSYSSIISNCFFIEWSPYSRKLSYLILNICTLGPILSRLPVWCQFIFTFSIGLSYIFLFLLLQMYPFFHSYANFLFSIFNFYLIIQQIMFSFRIILTTFFPMKYVFIIPLVVAVLAIPIYGYFFYKRNQKIISFLTGPENQLNDIDKPNFFDTAHFQNNYHVHPYLQLGVEKNLNYIIDFSFLHYLAARMRNKEILLSVARVVVFFPSESKFLNLILEAIGKFDNLNLAQRFFLFHAKKIAEMRQTHDINKINHHLYNLRKTSKDVIESIRGLWLEIIHSSGSISYTTFRYIYDTSHKMKNQFLDIISKCSDSYEAIDEYTYFLIEGLSDFTGSIEWEMKKRMIEKGVKMGLDYSFLSFVNFFPHYLTKDIMDKRGNFISNDFMKQSIVTLAQAPSLITMKDSEYVEKNSTLIDDTISQGQLRISIQNALRSANFKTFKTYENLNIVQLVSIICLFIFFAIFLPFQNDDSIKLLDSFDLVSYTSIDLLLNSYYQSVRVAFEDNRITSEWDNESLPMTDDDFGRIQSIYGNTNAIMSIVDDTIEYCTLFFKTLTQNPKIYDYCKFLLKPIFSLKIFKGSHIEKVVYNLTFSQMLRYISALSQRTASRSSSPNFKSENQIDNRLTVAYNSIYLGNILENLRQILVNAYDDIGGSQQTTNLALGVLVSVVVIVIFLPLQIVLICNLYSSVLETIKALQKVNPSVVEKSLLPIQLHQMPQPLAKGSYLLIFQGSVAFVILSILGFLSVTVPAAILFTIPYINYKTLVSRLDCFVWHYLSGSRLALAAMGVSTAYINLVINENHYSELIEIFNHSINQLFQSQSLLLMGSDVFSTIIGVDKELNEFLFLDTCDETSANDSAFVDYVKCVSVDRAINYLQYLFIKIMDKFNNSIDDAFNTFLYDDYIDNLLLMDFRLIDSIKAYQVKIVQFVNDSFDQIDELMIILLLIGIVVSSLIFIGIFYGPLKSLRISFDGIKQMIRFLPPNDILNSPQLIGSVFSLNENSFAFNDKTKQSQAQTILAAARNGVVSINSNGTIEMINQSFVNMSGYNQEQLVGQNFLSLFTSLPDSEILSDHNEGIQKLKSTIDLMQNGLMKYRDSFPFHCQLENRNILTSYVYVIGIDDNDDDWSLTYDGDDMTDTISDEQIDSNKGYKKLNDLTSFLIVFRDLSEESKQKNKSSEIQKKSEILMRKVIPAAAYKVVYAQSGPTMFASNTATIIIAKITGMIETIHALLPHSVISLVGSYFDHFDEIANHYKVIHPVFTTENLYVACCGLFDYEDDPVQQAKEAVLFALEVKEKMNGINKELESSFKIKFEINLGGPLYGCVLDNQTPNFNLYGLMFDQAMDLIFNAEYETVEIGPTVHDLIVNDKQFEITQQTDQDKPIQFYQLFNVARSSST